MRKIVGKVISGQGLATGFLKETFFEEVLGFPPYELSIDRISTPPGNL
jgi:hypothetical protein